MNKVNKTRMEELEKNTARTPEEEQEFQGLVKESEAQPEQPVR